MMRQIIIHILVFQFVCYMNNEDDYVSTSDTSKKYSNGREEVPLTQEEYEVRETCLGLTELESVQKWLYEEASEQIKGERRFDTYRGIELGNMEINVVHGKPNELIIACFPKSSPTDSGVTASVTTYIMDFDDDSINPSSKDTKKSKPKKKVVSH